MNKKEANKSALKEIEGVAQPKSISVKVASILKIKSIRIKQEKLLKPAYLILTNLYV